MWCCLVLPSRIPPLRIWIGQEPEKLLVNTQICEQFCLVTLPKLKVSLNYGERWRRPNRLQKKTVLFWRALPLWCRWRESLGRGVGWATKARQGSWHSWELPESLERGDQSLEGRIHPSAIPGATRQVNCFYCYQMSLHPRQDFQRVLRWMGTSGYPLFSKVCYDRHLSCSSFVIQEKFLRA